MPRRAFTLIELLVVISIIGLLSTVVIVATNSARINSRNTLRKANLIQISKALELYYAQNGLYPSTNGTANWHGACASYGPYPDAYVDSTHDAWIPNLTPTYMARLPHDPNTDKGNPNTASGPNCNTYTGWNCYQYTSTGTDYKVMAHCTPEGTWTSADPFYDPARSTWAWRVTNNPTVTDSW